MNTKFCSLCEKDKDIELFSFKNKEKGIRSSWCKSCHKEKAREAHVKGWDRILKKRKEKHQERKNWFNEYKSKQVCSKCPENHPGCLDFHHTNPEEKEMEVTMMLSGKWSLDRIKKEIEKCIVLCSNCHRKLHWEEKNSRVV